MSNLKEVEEKTRRTRAQMLAMFPGHYRLLAEAYAALSVAEFAMNQHTAATKAWEVAVEHAHEATLLAFGDDRPASRTDS